MFSNPVSPSAFRSYLFEWWKENKRILPWRVEGDSYVDPYKILVSEFMLQQTQVSRIIPRFNKWMECFPKIEQLASATNLEVIRHWSGLGYNRRAIWLRDAAKVFIEDPTISMDHEQLIKVKGIGRYTSRAIPIFSHNMDLAAVDVNVTHVLRYHGFITGEEKPKEVQRVAQSLIPPGRSRDYHSALLDYGSSLPARRKIGMEKPGKNESFYGSDRELRGKIIKLLIDGRSYDVKTIATQLDESQLRIRQLCNKLRKDGLLQGDEDHYTL